MCCLFGMLDYGHSFTGRQRSRLLSVLGRECEARGTDATGVAYNSDGRLHIYKRPLPAHRLHLRIPEDAWVVMGHTRLTTQGNERRNYNNHPFPGRVGGLNFALAHNGVLHNDKALRKTEKLPISKIETDSYEAVQLLDQQKALTFDSLKHMAEKVEGSFSFTVLDEKGNLYFVKGDNPLCLYHFPKMGLYLYASTQAILDRALKHLGLWEEPVNVELICGDLLRIDGGGNITQDEFDPISLFRKWQYSLYSYPPAHSFNDAAEEEYIGQLKTAAAAYGYEPEAIDALLAEGVTTDELEDLLYCGEL